MLKLENLLFSENPNIDLEQIDDIPFGIHQLIDKIQKISVQELNQKIDQNLIDPKSKKCQQFRQSNQSKRLKREEKLKNLKDWDDFEKKELDQEDKMDIEILQLRKTLDNQKGQRNPDKINHSYIQQGTIIGNKLEGNKGFLKRKDKKTRILEQFQDLDKYIDKSKTKK